MKFMSLTAAALAFAFPAFAQTTVEIVSYNTKYDNASLPLSDVACSDGVYGLETKGYTTLGSLPDFPFVGGAYTVFGGGDSPACGTCYNFTSQATGTTIYVLIVDSVTNGFVISEAAMNALTDGNAVELGRIDVDATLVDAYTYCGLSARLPPRESKNLLP